jgi:hypothetical protein
MPKRTLVRGFVCVWLVLIVDSGLGIKIFNHKNLSQLLDFLFHFPPSFIGFVDRLQYMRSVRDTGHGRSLPTSFPRK